MSYYNLVCRPMKYWVVHLYILIDSIVYIDLDRKGSGKVMKLGVVILENLTNGVNRVDRLMTEDQDKRRSGVRSG